MDLMCVGLAGQSLRASTNGIGQQRSHGGRERGGALLALHQRMRGRGFGHIAPARGDDRQAGRHGFENGERHALGLGGVDEDIRRRVGCGLGRLVEKAEPVDACRAAALADHAEQLFGVGGFDLR